MTSRRSQIRIMAGGLAGLCLRAQPKAPEFANFGDEQKEEFLRSAKITAVQDIGHGVTKPIRASLEWKGLQHFAKIQVVDKELPDFFGAEGKPVPMRDSWRFNVAAYKIDRLLGLRMVTVAVERAYRGKPAAFSWWVDDVMFEEVERVKRDLAAPDPEDFDRQREVSRVFDELVINIDRNLSNLLITKSWKLALIDHSRCFTPYPGIRNRANLTRCSRGLMASMRSLTLQSASQAAGRYLTAAEVKAMIARRDRIVEFFEKEIRSKGEEHVLFA